MKYTIAGGSAATCPPLYPGLRVNITVRPEVEALPCLRVVLLLTEVLEDGWFRGEVQYDIDEIRKGMEFQFKPQHAECVEGGIEYMKKYQYISVEKAIVSGVKPRVVYYGMMDDPWHCHRLVSSQQESSEDFIRISVLEFLKEFPAVEPYMDHPRFTNFYWNEEAVGAFNFRNYD